MNPLWRWLARGLEGLTHIAGGLAAGSPVVDRATASALRRAVEDLDALVRSLRPTATDERAARGLPGADWRSRFPRGQR